MFDTLRFVLGGGLRLPRDQTTRIPRRVRKLAAPQIGEMQAALDEIGGMPGIADVGTTKQVPRGFYAAIDKLVAAYDAYVDIVRAELGLQDKPRPGEPGGCGACYAAPFGVSGIEAIHIARKVRTRPDFPKLGQRAAELGEAQVKEIQALAQGTDPAKIRFGSKAVQQGRVNFAKTKQACAFLDESKERCKIWEHRPMVCRMHHPTTDPAWSDPAHPNYAQVKAKNLRLPVKPQATLVQLDKRMGLQIAPFLYASLLQVLQLAEGSVLHEVGEPQLRLQQDGRMQQRANRSRATSKKAQKRKGKGKKRK